QPFVAPTNQVFVALDPEKAEALSRRVEMGFWENLPDGRVVMRLATSWATTAKDVDVLIEAL
ncbi:MAG: low specificity L-threonine aldolase, partial [Clostridia bacterium]|nr:low specificity L-threonine aldolase [Clostridia bacterium]